MSQRALAQQLGLSQGHLSKLLRGKGMGDSRGYQALREWSDATLKARTGGISSRNTTMSRGYLKLAAAARVAAGDSPRVMHIVIQMMHLVSQLQSVAISASRRKRQRASR